MTGHAASRARIIISVWGEKYVARLDFACIPALLAPGNLPHLAQHFSCELAIVTEEKLFDQVRALPGIIAAQQWCKLELIAMDDVMSHPSYYGYTITQALYKGFTSLGEAARDVWCLFLNADFILADGSYRSVVKRIQQGERCILAPSYCSIEEEVKPVLERRAAEGGGVLAMAPREMAGLVLDHRHFTIRAKVINSRMFRIDRADQFYYVVDNDTMVGRQIPIAVVAFRPEVVPAEAQSIWDYGVISDVCPDSRLCVLGDSDDFMMLELRGYRTMGEQLKIGWMDPAEIARDLSLWTTRDQRACGEFDLVLHRGDLPPSLPEGRAALDRFYRDVFSRVSPQPRDHRNHYIWNGIVELHEAWKAERAAALSRSSATTVERPAATPTVSGWLGSVFGAAARSPYQRLYDFLRGGYNLFFGRMPDLGLLHPQRADVRPVLDAVAALGGPGKRVLSLYSLAGAAIGPHLSRWFGEAVTGSPEDLAVPRAVESLKAQGPFDACVIEATRDQFARYASLHQKLRTIVRPGGTIMVVFHTRGMQRVPMRDFQFIAGGMPASDIGHLQVRGGFVRFETQWLWEWARRRTESGRAADLVLRTAIAVLLAPLSAWGNWRAGGEPLEHPTDHCTSLLLEVKIL